MKNNIIKTDSAGFIYPYSATKDFTAQFRIEYDFDENIDVEILREAIAMTQKRMPTFFVHLIKDGSLYKLEKTEDNENIIYPEGTRVCAPFDFSKIPIRVTVNGNRMGVEIFHCLADGHGGLMFSKTFIHNYYCLKGEHPERDEDILDCSQSPKEEETEDSFLKAAKSGNKSLSRFESFAFQYAPKDERTSLSLSNLKFSSDEVYKVAKKYGTSVTFYLAAVYVYSFLKLQKKPSKRPIKISVPVDLRKMFDSNTVRNFSLYFIVSIKPDGKNRTLSDIIGEIKEQTKSQLEKQNFANMAYTNVKAETSKFVEKIPLPVKRFILGKIGYTFFGEKLYSSTFSNLGIYSMPGGLKEHIKDMRIMIGETVSNQINLGALSYNGITNLMFTYTVKRKDLQKMYCEILADDGIAFEMFDRDAGQRDYTKA